MRLAPSIAFSLFLLFFLQSVAYAQAAYEFIPGQSWLSKDDNSRVLWAWGAMDGQSLLIEKLGKKEINKLQSDRLPAEQLTGMVDVMTQLYRDPSNTYIPWKYMAVVAAMKLRGSSQSTVNKRLESLREYGSWLRERKKN